MYVYKCMQARSTGEVLVYLVRKRPLPATDAMFMHYRVLAHWHVDTLGE